MSQAWLLALSSALLCVLGATMAFAIVVLRRVASDLLTISKLMLNGPPDHSGGGKAQRSSDNRADLDWADSMRKSSGQMSRCSE